MRQDHRHPPLVIPFFIPHQGCPHQCIFCNQSVITGQPALASEEGLEQTIRKYLSFKGHREQVELAFFGGNFLGLPRKKIRSLLDRVRPWRDQGLIHSIRCSTRPDTITRDILDLVSPYGMDLVELGVQSMDNRVLVRSARGHTCEETVAAIRTLRAAGMGVGVQVMVGLPGDTREGAGETARILSGLKPDLARIYPVLVLSGSGLARLYEKGAYLPLSLDDAVGQTLDMYKIFTRAGVVVIRMGLQAGDMMDDPGQVLAGPWHPAFGHLVFSALMLDRACKAVENGLDGLSGPAELRVHPRSLSRLQGDKKANLAELGRRYPHLKFSITTDNALEKDQVAVNPL